MKSFKSKQNPKHLQFRTSSAGTPLFGDMCKYLILIDIWLDRKSSLLCIKSHRFLSNRSFHIAAERAAAAFHRGVSESHREWQPWVNYYCSKPMLACVFVLKCVCGVVGEALTLATGIIVSTQWSSIHPQEQGLLWAHLNEHSAVKSEISRLQYWYLTRCLLIRSHLQEMHNTRFWITQKDEHLFVFCWGFGVDCQINPS